MSIKIKFPKIPSGLEAKAEQTANRLSNLLGVFSSSGEKDPEQLTQWGVNRRYYLRTFFYMYLFTKYSNSCVVDVSPPCNTFPDICECDMVLKIYSYELESITKKKHYEQYLTNYARSIMNCLKTKTIAVVPIKLIFPAKTGAAHANILVFRQKNKTIDVIEPHGMFFMGRVPGINIRGAYSHFTRIFNEILPNKSQPYTLNNSDQVCPRIKGVQSLERLASIIRYPDEGGGYCSIWSMFITEIILANPDVSTREILKSLYNLLYDNNNNNKTEIGNYLLLVARGYATFIERKVSEYYINIFGEDTFRLIELGGTPTNSRYQAMRRLFKPFLSIQSELSMDKSMTLTKIRNKIIDNTHMSESEKKQYNIVIDKMMQNEQVLSAVQTRSPGIVADLRFRKTQKTQKTQKTNKKQNTITIAKYPSPLKTTNDKKRCPNGFRRNKTTRKCDPKTKTTDKCDPKTKTTDKCDPKTKTTDKCDPKTKTTDKCDPKTKTTDKCDPKTKTTDKCDPKTKTTGSVVKKITKRCQNGYRRNRNTGNCDKKTL